MTGARRKDEEICGAKMRRPPVGHAQLRCGKPAHVDEVHAAYDSGGYTHPTAFLASWREGD